MFFEKISNNNKNNNNDNNDTNNLIIIIIINIVIRCHITSNEWILQNTLYTQSI